MRKFRVVVGLYNEEDRDKVYNLLTLPEAKLRLQEGVQEIRREDIPKSIIMETDDRVNIRAKELERNINTLVNVLKIDVGLVQVREEY